MHTIKISVNEIFLPYPVPFLISMMLNGGGDSGSLVLFFISAFYHQVC